MISEKALRLVTREGFVKEFWRDLKEARDRGGNPSHREIYEDLEHLYERTFQGSQFGTFDAFRKYRDRH